MAVRAVVFDLFDTLVDLKFEDLPRLRHAGQPVSPSAAALHGVLRDRTALEFGAFLDALAETDAELRERQKLGIEIPSEERFAALLTRLGIDDPELPATLTGIHMGVLRQVVSVPEHHADVLRRLSRRVRLGLCSNFTHSETALGILDEAGLSGHLDAVAISDSVGYRKPRGEIFEAVLAELGVTPDEALHVGDNLRADVGGARALGIRTAWLTRRVADPEGRLRDHDGPHPDFCINDLAELSAWLDGGEKS